MRCGPTTVGPRARRVRCRRTCHVCEPCWATAASSPRVRAIGSTRPMASAIWTSSRRWSARRIGRFPIGRSTCYDRALDLWRGPAYGEFTGEWWALAESRRLGEMRLVAREQRAAALIAIGHQQPGRSRPRRPRRRASVAGAPGEPADASPSCHRSPGRGAARVPHVPGASRRRDRPRSVRRVGQVGTFDRRRRRVTDRQPAWSTASWVHPPRGGRGRCLRSGVLGDPAGHEPSGGDQGDPPGSGRLGRVHPPVRGRGPTRRPAGASAHRPALRLLA